MRGKMRILHILAVSAIILLALSSVALSSGIFNCGAFPRTGQYSKTDPLVAGCEKLFEWREIEPEEGKYNFELIDQEIEPWIKAGKKVAIRIMSACNEKNAAPMWIFEQAEVQMVDSSKYSSSNIIFPMFWNDTFVKKYEAMIKALARRYDGKPGIEFVQVGGVGRWEETYVHTENDQMSKRWQELGYMHRAYIAHVKRMVDIFKRNFKKTPIVLSISIGGPDPNGDNYQIIGYELAEYAVSKGLYLKQNGWGAYYSYTNHDHFSRIYQRYRGKTKLFFEQGYPVANGWSPEPGPFRSVINRALIDCVDYLWIYEEDLSKPEFHKDLEFAVKHLGQRSYKDAGPLYLEFKEVKMDFKNPDCTKAFQDESYGLYNRHPWNAQPTGGKLEPAEINGRKCKKTNKENPNIYIDIEDSVILEECSPTNYSPTVKMTIEYLDRGTGKVRIDYNWLETDFHASSSFNKGNTGDWVKKEVILSCVVFPTCKLGDAEKDFRIVSEDEDLYISKVSLEFPSKKSR